MPQGRRRTFLSYGGRGAAVAQWLVVPLVAGSNPVDHPIKNEVPRLWDFVFDFGWNDGRDEKGWE